MLTDNQTLNPEDLDPASFDDPVSLLHSLKNATKVPFTATVSSKDLFYLDDTSETQLITPVGIATKYELPVDFVRSLVITKDIKPICYIPVFSIPEIEAFYENHDFSNPPIVDAFLYELDHMRTNYSYKPLLLLSILTKANENGELSLSEIIDYYLDYYAKRKSQGLVVEKNDSSFAKNYGDRLAAKRTITTYPLKIYCDKGFLSFSASTNTISVVPELWRYFLSLEDKSSLIRRCFAILDEYYLYL